METPSPATNNTLTIEVGKFYKLRNGMKYRCYATDGGLGKEIHGAVCSDSGWHCLSNNRSGKYTCAESFLDIVSEWTEPYDVRNIPIWAKWVARDGDEGWMVYSLKPEIDERHNWWIASLPSESCCVPQGFHPNFTGPWRESLHYVDHEKGILIKHNE